MLSCLFIPKIPVSDSFRLGYLLSRGFLRLLDNPVRGYYYGIVPGIPECEKAVGCFLVQRAKFPYIRIFQFLEEFGVHLASGDPVDIIKYLLIYLCRELAEEVLRFVQQYQLKARHLSVCNSEANIGKVY